MNSVKIRVPATIANIGPGFDVLGLALEGLFDEFLLSLCEGESRIESVSGVDASKVPMNLKHNIVLISAHAMAAHLGRPVSFSLSLSRQLPIGGGLGSSAAASLAGAIGAARLLGTSVSDVEILQIAMQTEGHLDNLAPAYYGGMTIALDSAKAKVLRLSSHKEWSIVVVTPSFRLPTRQARAVLPTSSAREEWIPQMAHSCGVVAAYVSGDEQMMRVSLHDSFAEPRRAALIPGFYDVKRAALKHGALGCSISGAGPSVFAICSDEVVANDCAQAMKAAFGLGAVSHVGRVANTGVQCE